MDQVIQFLFNTNHDMPDIWTIVVLAILAYVVPLIARRYVAAREAKKNGSSTAGGTKNSHSSASSPKSGKQ